MGKYVSVGELIAGRFERPQVQNQCNPDGTCAGCGDCCRGDSLPITEMEARRIAEYVEQSGIVPAPRPLAPFAGPVHYMRCPFLRENRCQIYKVRPLICRSFLCSKDPVQIERFKMKRIRECRGEADMWQMFYPENGTVLKNAGDELRG